METYTDFEVYYLIQDFVNKINTKLWNGCRIIPTSRFSNFQKELFKFYETIKNECVVRIEAVVFTLLTKVTTIFGKQWFYTPSPPLRQASARHCFPASVYS